MHGGKYPFNILFAYLSLMAVFTISLLALKYLDGKEKSTDWLCFMILPIKYQFLLSVGFFMFQKSIQYVISIIL